jgi:hypothetical protein
MMITIKKNKQKIWVTFTFLSTEIVESIVLSGEWNEWKEESMKQKKNGDYYITKVFKTGDNFQFGYKVNGNEWITEEECSSVPSPFTTHNSLLTL